MKHLRIKPGSKVDLKDWDPSDHSGFDGGEPAARERLITLRDKLEKLQELLYAEHKHRLLIVLQAMDTGGKDGVIAKVFDGVNPQGVRVASFKSPTPPELDHDYLWRIHPHVPGKGEIAIFNRSHYEDLLIVRVHKLAPDEVWKRRYAQINDFERMLTEEGVAILKFYLHIDRDEQKQRLQARLDDPTKHWKFNVGDLAERKLWSDYMNAYEDVLTKTSTEWAPWTIVPANHKWFRNLVVIESVVGALENFDMKYPPSPPGLDKIIIDGG